MTKDDVAAALDEIGTLLQLQGENDFRVRAYTNGARTIQQLEGDIRELVSSGKLNTIRGIGDTLQQKITTLVTTGSLPQLEELRASVPAGLIEMLRLPGVGPKKVKAMHDALGVDTIAKLKVACESGEVAGLKGFGDKTAAKILQGIEFLDQLGKRVRFDLAFPLGERLLNQVRTMPGVIRAELCGSLRRRRDTSKDIDILASSANAGPIMEAFCKLPEVMHVVVQGSTKSSIVAKWTQHGETIVLNADLRVVSDEQFPFALNYFTGSKEHNIRVRQMAIELGWSLNEYGLTGKNAPKEIATEPQLYESLGLTYIEPELREDTGEVEASLNKQLPDLVTNSDIRGVFHNHSTYSDGTATLETMAKKCQSLGWEYFGIGDHSKSLNVANGLSEDRVRQQWAEIDQLNKKFKNFQILKGTECDILTDGSLDYSDELLAGFDYVVASVHTHFTLSEDDQTERVCKALRHPATTMLGHATGRLLLRRPGFKIDLEKVLRTAVEHNKMIEINAQPMRLDLDWTWVKRAKALGVMIVINPDAHSPEELELVPHGVNVARRGWLTKAEVFNTRGLKDVLKYLKKREG